MRKFGVALVLVVLCLGGVGGQSFGGGLSAFVPEELYTTGTGVISFEQGTSWSMGFGDFLSFPLGLAYHSVGSFTLEDATGPAGRGPDLFGDVLIPSAQVKAHVGLGPIYFEAHGGGALAYAFSLRPTADFARAMTPASASGALVALDAVTLRPGLGLGWLAGGAVGVTLGSISVDIGATYRSLRIPVSGSAAFRVISGDSVGATQTQSLTDNGALLRGLSVQLSGSYKL